MFKTPFKQRPKHLVAIYVEELQVEILRAHRQWRNWQIESTEVLPIAESDNLFDFLQRLNIRPRDKRSTALVLFLPRTYYSFHRELYPVSQGPSR